ncbi:type 1 glutamine amidotransferase [Bacillus spongiae]|uniref:Type 1 glutamine amidotransferase n=1 Tax=Bacillus spongiae TaxID=2683610 RepID=A0ABU8HAK8_9BACI
MRLHYFQHVEYEDLGFIYDWCAENDVQLSKTEFYKEEPIFPDLNKIDGLVVLGGSMSVRDIHQYPWMTKEMSFIQEAIKCQKKIIGICMGAQLIAKALGSTVTQNKYEEIGWHSVDGIGSNKLSTLFRTHPSPLFQWHSDTFKLPKDSILLAKSDACSNQAFIYNHHVLAMQFHLEFTKEIVTHLLHDEGEPPMGPFTQSSQQIIHEEYFLQAKELLNKILTVFFKN